MTRKLEESLQLLQNCVILSPEADGLVLTRLNSTCHQDSIQAKDPSSYFLSLLPELTMHSLDHYYHSV